MLAAGGFEADPGAAPALPRRRAGSTPKVRGTPHNTGELLAAALAAGAATGGDWSSCHSVAWDAWHPANEGNRELTNRLTRSSYPLGHRRQRATASGSSTRAPTSATTPTPSTARAILEQPGGDRLPAVRRRHPPAAAERGVRHARACRSSRRPTLDELADRHRRRPARRWPGPSRSSTPRSTAPCRSTRRQGRPGRAGVEPPKSQLGVAARRSRRSSPIPVTCGITFTFGGLHGDTDGRVLDDGRRADPGAVRVRRDAGRAVQRQLPGRDGADIGHGVRPTGRVAGLSPAVTRRAIGCRRRSGWLRKRRRRS